MDAEDDILEESSAARQYAADDIPNYGVASLSEAPVIAHVTPDWALVVLSTLLLIHRPPSTGRVSPEL
ncbi:hypothetical protein GEV33_005570 [Tenebrio molitor]|uniref:Uncharacterized protein n=1 Tax=Tenebrio molitor TaxID=7067 RepID=A0A8J6LLQ5_TENMO|nr:hypothetical protein GEV33_005570 [Tenebrio molitor]